MARGLSRFAPDSSSFRNVSFSLHGRGRGRHYELWHDRAVFHFMSGVEIAIYQELVKQSIAPGGSIIMATVSAPFGHDIFTKTG
jgi:hypothetical protein